MKKILLLIIAIAVSTLFAEKDEYIVTDSGLKYKIIEKGTGEIPKANDVVSVHYTGKLEDGTIFDSSIDRGQPIQFTLGIGQVIAGWDEAISLFKAGTKAELVIPPELAYGDKKTGSIPKNSTLIFEVELVDFLKMPRVKPYSTDLKEKHTTESGIEYYIVKKGKGELPKSGDKVKVNYSGYLKNGKLFDSSIKRGQPFTFTLGQKRVILGWEESVALMTKGSKYRFIIPAELAYGDRQIGIIPKNSDLIFDIQLLDINGQDENK